MNASKQALLQYPAPSGPYKVFLKGKSTWRGYDTARLQISVGNPKQDGDKLLAMTEWAAARFDKVIFIVSDTLQRHNLALRHGVGPDDARALALMEGREWLSRNEAAIRAVPAAQRIVTVWDQWLSHPDYQPTRGQLEGLYDQSEDFRDAVAAKALQFCHRHGQGIEALDTSREFLLEELAAFAIMFRETPAADFYAGTWLDDIFAALAPAAPQSELLRGFQAVECVEVDFIRNKGAK